MLLAAVIGAAVIVGFGIYLSSPSLLAAIAVPCQYLSLRIGGQHTSGLSVADFMLFIGTLAVLPLVVWGRIRAMRAIATLMVVYQFCTLISVMAHPNRDDAIEWFHELMMVLGGMIVGYVLVQRNRARLAMILFLVASAVVALGAIGTFLIHGGHVPKVLGLQKNAAGVELATATLVAFVNPSWLNLSRRLVRWTLLLCMVGVLATTSRNAIISLVLAALVAGLRTGRFSFRSLLLFLALAPMAVVAYLSIKSEVASHSTTDSISQRVLWYNQAMALWRQSPIWGQGERFWYHPGSTLKAQPPNMEISMLATGGVVGLTGLVILVLGTLYLLWRMPKVAGTLAFAVMLAHTVEGQFDVYWVAGTGTIPWIIAGMACAVTDSLDPATRLDAARQWAENRRQRSVPPGPRVRPMLPPAGP